VNETTTTILQVVLGPVSTSYSEVLAERFGRFYNETTGEIQYPTSCDSHAFDVFSDEFEDPGVDVSVAKIIELPYPVEQFTPFTEESAGTELAEWVPGARGWNTYDATACDTPGPNCPVHEGECD